MLTPTNGIGSSPWKSQGITFQQTERALSRYLSQHGMARFLHRNRPRFYFADNIVYYPINEIVRLLHQSHSETPTSSIVASRRPSPPQEDEITHVADARIIYIDEISFSGMMPDNYYRNDELVRLLTQSQQSEEATPSIVASGRY